jgi:Ca2+-binding EF-hand superfamily protein
LAVCFTIYDEDRNGVITKEELLKLAWSKAKAEGRASPEQRELIKEAVNKIVFYVDKNSDGQLSEEELVEAINKHPELKEVL